MPAVWGVDQGASMVCTPDDPRGLAKTCGFVWPENDVI